MHQGVPCDVGPRKLTLLQVVDKPAQPFVYAWPPSTSTIMPSQHLRHVPDQVLPWLGVTEQACAFRERLPATPAVYGCYMPTIMQPNNEGTALWLLDNTFFSVANQLGNEPGLAAIKFNEFPEGFKLAGKCTSLACTHQAIFLVRFHLLASIELSIAWPHLQTASTCLV